MSTHGRDEGRDGHDGLGARRRASWGRRDDEHEETHSHAGNATVNHGPEEQGSDPKGQDLEGRAPDDSGSDDPGEDGPGGDEPRSDDPGADDSRAGVRPSDDLRSDDSRADEVNADDLGADGSRAGALRSVGPRSVGSGPDRSDPARLGGFEPDGLVLRDLLQQAVSEIEPRDGTLEHLRRAVPARRARKRQALVGMAAAALFIGTAIPALVHVSSADGSAVNPSIMGKGSQTQGTEGQSKGQSGGDTTSGGSPDGSKESGKNKDQGATGKGQSNGSTGGAEATPTPAVATLCTAAQLGGGGSVGVPDSGGAVYGTFRVSNISGTSCTVTGAGGVSTTPQGAADGSKITVANHVAGDAAAGLPDPSLSLAQLVLEPGAAYEVRFAWVPSEPCPTTGGTPGGGTGGPDPSPEPTPTEQETGGTTTDGGNSATTQLLTEDGGVADGSVLISHTAEGGVAAFTTSVGNACAGVVYRTGLLTGA
ncbi:hypothetical protein WBG99_15920 [Streptomyces sp. TG1A-60]|uniref:hypothetical protein n=1 Tax=Streptomyces sp. TG1A-60 TaxID=3129111 RepID=UPI0030CF5F8E